MTEERLKQIEQELALMKDRNVRVAGDKAWETSAMRIGTICAITYVLAALTMFLIGSEGFWLNALVPPLGFFLSAQSLPAIKRWWLKSRYRP